LAKQAPRVAFMVDAARHSGRASGAENWGETISAKWVAGKARRPLVAFLTDGGRPQKHQAASITIV
jgi:hypothetical protein